LGNEAVPGVHFERLSEIGPKLGINFS
jgi:hypothetical protein